MVEVGMIKMNMKKEMEMQARMQEEEISRQRQMLKEMRPGRLLALLISRPF